MILNFESPDDMNSKKSYHSYIGYGYRIYLCIIIYFISINNMLVIFCVSLKSELPHNNNQNILIRVDMNGITIDVVQVHLCIL